MKSLREFVRKSLVENAVFDRKEYLKWKRKNVTYRGMQETGAENGGMAKYGSGLYTAALSNKTMAKQYGKVYYVVNAVPKHPKIVFNTNEADMSAEVVRNYKDFFKEINMPVEVHSDYASITNHKSNGVVTEASNYMKTHGFNLKIKPESWSASYAADHFC